MFYKDYFPPRGRLNNIHPCYGKNMMMDKKLSMIEFPFFQMNFIPKNVMGKSWNIILRSKFMKNR